MSIFHVPPFLPNVLTLMFPNSRRPRTHVNDNAHPLFRMGILFLLHGFICGLIVDIWFLILVLFLSSNLCLLALAFSFFCSLEYFHVALANERTNERMNEFGIVIINVMFYLFIMCSWCDNIYEYQLGLICY